jgi:fatty acid synthase subunit alpha
MGKTSTAMTGRLVSLKMPGGFGIGTVRDYLQTKWGLATGRQDSVLLRASTMQPAARMPTVVEAQTFFDDVVKQYAEDQGLDLSTASNNSTAVGAVAVAVDSKALTAITKQQEALRQAKLELYAKYLGKDLRADVRETIKAQKMAVELQSQLDSLSSELGDPFLSGIRSMWAAPKIRRFDSNWNWVLQDTLELFHAVLRGTVKENTFPQYSNAIANRSTPRLVRMMRHMMENPSPEWRQRFHLAKGILSRLIRLCEATHMPSFKPLASNADALTTGPSTTIDEDGKVQYKEVRRPALSQMPSVHIQTKEPTGWDRNQSLTSLYMDLLQDACQDGLSFAGKYILLTGASPGSIGAEILKGLLSGGARVVVTTSSYSFAITKFYQELYVRHGSRGSELIVAPFNQGSQQDLEALVLHIFDPVNGLGWDLDHVIPFAAISIAGREIDNIDSKSEFALRIMLTNTLRLLGAIKRQKELRGYYNRPTQVIVPMSPNHGGFGNDGLYGESKIALETLFEKWHSETWSDYLSICGAVIGWTRGTGLMADNNIVAAGIEKLGVRTFSQAEMAFYVLVLMGRKIAIQSDLQPIYADLTGGLNAVPNLKAALDKVKREVSEVSNLRLALAKEKLLEKKAVAVGSVIPQGDTAQERRANIQFNFPQLPDFKSELEPLSRTLRGMADLDRVVVVAGFSEVGPHGNSRTRWEIEANGRLSLEGCIEMAWIMGLITNHNGQLDGTHYTGWIDTKTRKPVNDIDIKAKYEEHILSHTGIRLIEPEMDDGYQPEKKQFLQEIILEDDLPPFEVSKEMAEQMAHEHGDKTDVYPGGADHMVRLKKGATLMVPKALRSDRTVAGQVPTGWDARTYGIPPEIISQVDRGTLFTLVSTVEALIACGITDPYELYKYIHVSELGNCIGSGLGGLSALKGIFKNRYLDKPVQNDILQETFINTTAAWINMLLISSSGPIRTPVGACATSIESLETGYETIVSGKAKMCLVGGYDDLAEATSYEFGNMKATSNADEETKKGRLPQDMSRPTTTTRSGFMESQGSGVQVITSARLALDMGLPIYGVVAFAGTSSDKIGRSVPAPGQGILTNARERNEDQFPSPLLDIRYRKQRLHLRMRQIQESVDIELRLIKAESLRESSPVALEQFQRRIQYVQSEAERQRKEALNTFGNEFWKNDSSISPIRGSLAVWGLTIGGIFSL